MTRWSFYYGGQLMVHGLNDKARAELEETISSVRSLGNAAWFTASNPSGPGAFSIYLQAGVPIAFLSEDADLTLDDGAVHYGAADDE